MQQIPVQGPEWQPYWLHTPAQLVPCTDRLMGCNANVSRRCITASIRRQDKVYRVTSGSPTAIKKVVRLLTHAASAKSMPFSQSARYDGPARPAVVGSSTFVVAPTGVLE